MTTQLPIEDAMRWLRSKHTTMWGGHGWTVTSDDTCEKAAQWFCEQIEDFNKWRGCEGCEDTLIDLLVFAFTKAIGDYVPEGEQDQWNDLLIQYINYKVGNEK